MAFNPTLAYRTVVDLHGNVFVYQGETYYDRYGNSYATLPSSIEGFNPVFLGQSVKRLLGILRNANFNSTSDQAIAIQDPTKYRITDIVITEASTSLTTAVGGFYDAASKGGNVLVPATQQYSVLTSSTLIMNPNLTSYTGQVQTAATIYLSLTTAQGTAATADVMVYGTDL